jgi:hypothetical protein
MSNENLALKVGRIVRLNSFNSMFEIMRIFYNNVDMCDAIELRKCTTDYLKDDYLSSFRLKSFTEWIKAGEWTVIR